MLRDAKSWLLEKVIPAELTCRSCGATIQRPANVGETGLDTIVNCPQCDWNGTIDAMLDSRVDEPDVVTEQPRDSKIKLRVEPNLTRTWVFPASKKFNFLILFAIFWLGFISLFTVLMVAPSEESFDGFSKLGGLLFLIPFWLVGIFLFFSSLWMMFASQELTVKPDGRMLSVRRFFGITFRRKMDASRNASVKRVVAYTQNDKPVYTVEISNGKKNSIRLSSTMSDAEKSWMLSQLRSALGKEDAAAVDGAPSGKADGYASARRISSRSDLRGISTKTLTVRRMDSRSFEIVLGHRASILTAIFGMIFLGAAGFLGWECVEQIRGLDDSTVSAFDWPFILMPGFMALIFGTVALVIIFFAVGMKGRKRSLKFYEDHVVADSEWPIGAKGGRFEKNRFERVDMSRTGSSNGDARYSVKLLGPDLALPICRFRNEEEAGAVHDWAREWLGKGDG